MEKKCTKCGEVKPKGGFHKNASMKDGLQSLCKECAREMNRKWRAENPEKHRARSRKWAAENPEKVRATDRKYRGKNPEKERAQKRKWKAENPEKLRAQKRRWRAKNPEKARAAVREVRQKLRPCYIKGLLIASGLPPEIIEANPEIVELKRLQIKLNRKIKQKKSEL